MTKWSDASGRFAVKAASSFPDTLNVEQVTETPDGQGGQTENWSTLYSGVPCLLTPKPTRSTEEVEGGRVRSFTEYEVLTPALKSDGASMIITGKHRLTVQARTPFPAKTLLIDGAPDAQGLYYLIKAKHYN